MSQEIIKIEGLSKVFGRGESAVCALDNIDLSINRGEIFGIIGLSGAGKSTLVRCINMLERPTSGRVIVDGEDMTALRPGELLRARQNIGMIFQGFNLLMQRTALQNVLFPLEVAGIPKKQAREKARRLLDTVGLLQREGAYPAQLSGGQKQRIAIARALATDPKVLLCDEATSALDPTTTRSILSLLQEINRKTGVTVVVITHEMKVIEEICSRVAIISDSRIAEMGSVREVFTHPASQAAKMLIFPQMQPEKAQEEGAVLRLVFDGETTDRPIVANMALQSGGAANILFADTKVLEGKLFGQMLIRLPADNLTAGKMLAYLREENIAYQEEERKDV